MATNLRFLIALAAFAYQLGFVIPTTFTFLNKCDYTVWPGILSNAGIPEISTTGFSLLHGESRTITPPSTWGGRFWGRTLCTTDKSTNRFTCQTGDCGSGNLQCSGAGAATPATLAEFTLAGSDGQDFYDVSLVDGYNLPMVVSPQGGTGPNCSSTGCAADLNSGACPPELRVLSDDRAGESVACRSACDAFSQAEYCCSGAYGSPDTCQPSSYSEVFKRACPRAYSYAYDDKSSTFVCGGSPDYTITFCPSPTSSQKASSSSEEQSPPSTASSTEVPDLLNSSMVYQGALEFSSAKSNQFESSRIFSFLTTFWCIHWVLHHNFHQLY